MRTLVTILVFLSTSYALADLTSTEKSLCAASAIARVLPPGFKVLRSSVDLNKTAMQKYNLVANAAGALSPLESEQNDVKFVAVKDERTYVGRSILITSRLPEKSYWNNTTVITKNMLNNIGFKCTLTATQFRMTEDSYRDITASDLKLMLVR